MEKLTALVEIVGTKKEPQGTSSRASCSNSRDTLPVILSEEDPSQANDLTVEGSHAPW